MCLAARRSFNLEAANSVELLAGVLFDDMTDKPTPELELRHDGWERFERAVDAGLYASPKHRSPKAKPESKTKAPKPRS